MTLARDEYVEQAYLFQLLSERLPRNMPLQELLRQVQQEILATTQLPLAVDFLRTELEHSGVISTAMARLPHYFTPFQTYVMHEAENERGRFDIRTGLLVLKAEAEFRAAEASVQGIFLFQFETLCRNRLRYDAGLTAMSQDPHYDEHWRDWILTVRRQIGLIDITDLLWVRSEAYREKCLAEGRGEPEKRMLFGSKEGRIAAANRGKDPLYFFSALQRHLNYPKIPRPEPIDQTPALIPQIMRRLERIESRMKLMEEENREGIDLSKFYDLLPPDQRPPP